MPYRLWLAALLAASACTASIEPDGDDTDVSSDGIDSDDTDAMDTDAGDTDVADTDVADTDDTDVADTDLQCVSDSDHDGVCDDVDLCEGEDAYGDLDGDLICDNTDLCAGDNTTGDADGDGVCGNLDLCVGGDASGDTDGDGVCDDGDLCVGDDQLGDSDFDGSCDDSDLCTGDDRSGDSDADSVCDSDDTCPGGDDTVDLDFSGFPDDCEPRELARVPFQSSGYGSSNGQYAYAAALIEIPASCGGSGAPLLGASLTLEDDAVGTYRFDVSDGAAFSVMNACLRNGQDDVFTFWAGLSNGPGQAVPAAGFTRAETAFGGTPDVGTYVVWIDLEVTAVQSDITGPSTTSGELDGVWIFYGW